MRKFYLEKYQEIIPPLKFWHETLVLVKSRQNSHYLQWDFCLGLKLLKSHCKSPFQDETLKDMDSKTSVPSPIWIAAWQLPPLIKHRKASTAKSPEEKIASRIFTVVKTHVNHFTESIFLIFIQQSSPQQCTLQSSETLTRFYQMS